MEDWGIPLAAATAVVTTCLYKLGISQRVIVPFPLF